MGSADSPPQRFRKFFLIFHSFTRESLEVTSAVTTQVNKMENSDVSSDMSVSLHELSIEVKYSYITRKVFLIIRN